jgi:hypothetical protein
MGSDGGCVVSKKEEEDDAKEDVPVFPVLPTPLSASFITKSSL